jgi:hypothetical protein
VSGEKSENVTGKRNQSAKPNGLKNGGADGIRTHDLLDAIEARSQLRHGPTGDTGKVYHTPQET